MLSLEGRGYDVVKNLPFLSRHLRRELESQKQDRDLQYKIRETWSVGRSQWILTKLRWNRRGIYQHQTLASSRCRDVIHLARIV